MTHGGGAGGEYMLLQAKAHSQQHLLFHLLHSSRHPLASGDHSSSPPPACLNTSYNQNALNPHSGTLSELNQSAVTKACYSFQFPFSEDALSVLVLFGGINNQYYGFL